MGADTSKDVRHGVAGTARASFTSRIMSHQSRQTLIARWQKRQLPVQSFCVTRHAERADGIYAFIDGGRWTCSEDFKHWPLDPPLSDDGAQHAQEMGCCVEQFVVKHNTVMHVVISSPYFRCTQTAVLICKSLGPNARLLVDRSLGEVYGPSVMGLTEPSCPIRSMDQTTAFCRSHGIACQSRIIGKWPTWPEQLADARRRYVLRFLSYLQRSVTTRRNFVLVAHADCVGAVLSMMPSQMHQVVERVEDGGMFLARRNREECNKATTGFTSILPTTEEETGGPCVSHTLSDLDSVADLENIDDWRPAALQGNWITNFDDDGSCASHSRKERGKVGQMLQPPRVSDGWEVELHDIVLRKRQGAIRFQKRVQALARQGDFTLDRIEQLLGELGDKPLGGAEELELNSRGNNGRTGVAIPSYCSSSTYLFGASEVGSMLDIDGHSDKSDGVSTPQRVDTPQRWDMYASFEDMNRVRHDHRPKSGARSNSVSVRSPRLAVVPSRSWRRMRSQPNRRKPSASLSEKFSRVLRATDSACRPLRSSISASPPGSPKRAAKHHGAIGRAKVMLEEGEASAPVRLLALSSSKRTSHDLLCDPRSLMSPTQPPHRCGSSHWSRSALDEARELDELLPAELSEEHPAAPAAAQGMLPLRLSKALAPALGASTWHPDSWEVRSTVVALPTGEGKQVVFGGPDGSSLLKRRHRRGGEQGAARDPWDQESRPDACHFSG
uniref:Uncharacterized protein n=1 Tax=Pyrodinium bahamense TaxID=73915 RepID=A0A7S0AAC6_9DINO|mmetsp:Transcript_29491/g.80972  ORF Transcript_29491/g.80972 Transcript_29491/m.80972 type:complete len:725 (+) Transcript_29491:88-2262(+)|eukprot:CAMPEP_0179013612 /NCGR_PEP_ID=MMETSP0796-20121207/1818_1 /TAXON_ID=73915 /ORGANISM="Pyrodinium bahamense, Strain pbaha01" /LENGTH=724 /DNA_ID=CAMNT_0020709125 /DNA_START=28 /DNA_END=2202 /DNA_ORIENTATION=+